MNDLVTQSRRVIHLELFKSRNLIIQIKPFSVVLSHGTIYLVHIVLTFESVDEILTCYHSNKTSSAVLSHDTIYFSEFYKMKFGNF